MRKNKRIGLALAAWLLLLLGLLSACQSEKTPSVRAELQLAYASEEDWQNDTEAPRYQEPNVTIAPQLVLTTTAPVSQLRLVALTVTEEEETLVLREGETVYQLADFVPEQPLYLLLSFPGLMPTYALSYEDADGQTYHYYLQLSGEDGSPLLIAYTPGAAL